MQRYRPNPMEDNRMPITKSGLITRRSLLKSTAAAGAVLTAALVAIPTARAVIAVPAVAIGATAGGTGLMAVFELLGGDAAELNQ